MSAPTPLAAARWYLTRRGWAPVPVPYKAKAPVLKAWQELRPSVDDLADYFGDAPQNVGVLLGEASGGLADVDLDCAEARLLADGFLPTTGRVCGRASAPRSHWFYAVEGDLERTERFRDPLAAKGDERAVLVELRWTGCQTIVPPSVHPSGEPVAWEERGDAAVVGAGALRAAVARLAAAALLARRWPGEGSRQDAALALAGALLHAGWSEEEAEAFVAAVAHAAGDGEARKREETVRSTTRATSFGRNTTGWPTLARLVGDQVIDAVRGWLELRGRTQRTQHPQNGADKGHSEDSEDSEYGSGGEPAPWEPPVLLPTGERPPFPIHLLPPPLATFVAALAVATQTPAALPALLVLAAVAAAAAKRVAVVVRPGWREPVNLYALVALGSANRKSAVAAAVAAPLAAHERAEERRLLPEAAAAAARHEIAEQALAKTRRKAADAEGAEYHDHRERAERLARELVESPELAVPKPPRLLVDDVTPEKLAALMGEHGGRMAVLSAEGGLFEIMAGRFSRDGRSPNLDLFLKAHSGDDLPVDRLGREGTRLVAPALTLGLAPQPEVVRGLAGRPGFRGRGLLARFAYALPESLVGRRAVATPPVPDEVADAYGRVIVALLDLRPLTEADGSPKPRDLVFSDAADHRMRRFERALEPRLGPAGELGNAADWGGKLAGLVARLAGLFHAVEAVAAGEVPWEREVGPESVEAAVALAERFLVPHALTAFGEMGADPALEGARQVLAWFGDHPDVGAISRRDLHQRLRRRFPRPGDLAPPLAVLLDHGYLRERTVPSDGPGRRPSPVLEVNPLGRPQNPRNPQNLGDDPHFADCADSEDASGFKDPARDDGPGAPARTAVAPSGEVAAEEDMEWTA